MDMNCAKCRELLSEHVDGELAPEAERSVREHLEGCERCRRERDLVARIDAAAARLPRYEPGAAVLLRISEAIHGASVRRRTEFGAVLDMEELADFLRTDMETLASYIEEIPCFELGGRILFRRKSVEDWIEQRERCMRIETVRSSRDELIAYPVSEEGGASWTRSVKN